MTQTINPFAGAFTVDGVVGVAWRAIKYKQVPVIDPEQIDYDDAPDFIEEIDDKDWIIAVMVGDNRRHEIEVSEITMIEDDDYCSQCGQVGCSHGQ